MSAPHTDLEKQTKEHRGPLRGMFAVVLWALVLLGGLALWAFSRGGDPQQADVQVNDVTGVEQTVGENAGASANDYAEDDVIVGTDDSGAAPVEEDPTAVTVAPETVTAPQVGTGNPPDTDPGESQAAEPLDPVSDEAEGSAEQAPAQSENE